MFLKTKQTRQKKVRPRGKNGKKTVPPDGPKPLKKLTFSPKWVRRAGKKKNGKKTVALGRKKRKQNGGVF